VRLFFFAYLVTTSTYDTNLRLSTLKTGPSNSIQNLSYTYEANSNVATITDALRGETSTFGYDDLDRLTSASIPGAGGYARTWTYDAIGRMTARTVGATPHSYEYTDPNHVHAKTKWNSWPQFTYDANGNMQSRYGTAFNYDAENRFLGWSSVTFTYDGDGNRVKKTDNGVTTFYVGKHYEVTNGVVKKYYYFGGKRVAMKSGTTPPYYLVGDHLGSTSAVLNNDGTLHSWQTYYPFGERRGYSYPTDLPTDFRYTGQRQDPGDLMDYNAREYELVHAQFLQPDSIVPGAGDPQALNRYSYTRNNPLKYTDPSGHCWGAASGARSLPTYDVTCGNLDMALTIVQHPNANAFEKGFAGWYLATEGTAHVAAVVGTSIVAWAALVPAAGVAETACADGDCTNEAVGVAKQLGKIGPDSIQGLGLVERLAQLSTRGASTARVILGKSIEGSSQSYDKIAERLGGTYFKTVDGVYEALGRSKELAWQANEAFLRNQMTRRVVSFDFVNIDIDDTLIQFRNVPWAELPARVREIYFLFSNAQQYGYERIGNSFILTP